MRIRVLLVKRAEELFPLDMHHLHREEKGHIGDGGSVDCPGV